MNISFLYCEIDDEILQKVLSGGNHKVKLKIVPFISPENQTTCILVQKYGKKIDSENYLHCANFNAYDVKCIYISDGDTLKELSNKLFSKLIKQCQ